MLGCLRNCNITISLDKKLNGTQHALAIEPFDA